MIKVVEKKEYFCDICKKQIHGPSDLIEIKTEPYEDRGNDAQRYTLTRHVCVHCFKKMPLFGFHLTPFEQLTSDLRDAGMFAGDYGYDEDGNKRWIYYPMQNPKYEVYSPDGNTLYLKNTDKNCGNSYRLVTIDEAFNRIFTAWHNDYTDARRKENENNGK